MMDIDADRGEGGGQVLRAALALSAVRGAPVRLLGIRARRRSPGLQAQHITAVSALARICGAEVSGMSPGSQALTFTPGALRSGEYRFDIGTAGSIALVLQAILVPLALATGRSRVILTGGTHVPWSPSIDFVRDVLLPQLTHVGIAARLDVVRWGFYPKGGGCVVVDVIGGAVLSPLTVVHRPEAPIVGGLSAGAGRSRQAVERQSRRAADRLRDAGYEAAIETREVAALDPGRFVFLTVQSGSHRAGFSGLGNRDAKPEAVADAAVDALLEHLRTDAACDPFLADQLVVPLALATGTSRITTSRVTAHLLTALSVARDLLGCPTQVRGDLGTPGSITIEGVGIHGRAGPDGRLESPVQEVPRMPTTAVADSPALVRKARAGDGPAIQRLLAHFASRGELLHRTLNEVYQHLRDFVVCEADGRIVGVCALWVYWEDLAEVRSLAVEESYGGRGLGTTLVRACLDEAASLGIRRVFALTYRPAFFQRLGFRTLDKRELPQKIWKDCLRCSKFTCCDEVALIHDVAPPMNHGNKKPHNSIVMM
jgi:RNA 3'-terminal phosphate cyclase (ATP)